MSRPATLLSPGRGRRISRLAAAEATSATLAVRCLSSGQRWTRLTGLEAAGTGVRGTGCLCLPSLRADLFIDLGGPSGSGEFGLIDPAGDLGTVQPANLFDPPCNAS